MSDHLHQSPVFNRAADFISELWPENGACSEMHIGDLAWGTFQCWPSAYAALRLWCDNAGETQALTMFDGSGVCDLVIRPGPAGVAAAQQALDWAETAAVDASGAAVTEFCVGRRVQSTEVIELLHSMGFERRATGVPAMSRSLANAQTPSSPVPGGYTVREIGEHDLGSRVAAFNAAFPGDQLCLDAYRAQRACALYDQRLDIVATSPSSDVIAFATLWLDVRNAVVQIEPAGCHPDHRRLGLSRAVISEALRRSAELGATHALVRHVHTNAAAHALYESCGFTTVCEDTGFFKTVRR